jgi:hypothetical protein
LGKLTLKGGHGAEAVQVEPVYAREIDQILGQLAIDPAEYTFIDFGSGKGRALLIGPCYPFRRIVGVEFAKDLHDIAQQNIGGYRSSKKRCFDIQSIHANA